MASTISDIKKKRGRPPKVGGVHPGIFVRLPPEVIEALDRAAEATASSRSEVIRAAVERDLRLKAKAKAKAKAR